jgi:hypothetical protein
MNTISFVSRANNTHPLYFSQHPYPPYSTTHSLPLILYHPSSTTHTPPHNRISATLKARWEDPEFREKMLTRSFARTDEWRALVSDRIRQKWSDPEYRAAVAIGEMQYDMI